MSTHAVLVNKNDDRQVKHVHYDGYPDVTGREMWEGVGKIGIRRYVKELFDPGFGGWSFLCAGTARLAKVKGYTNEEKVDSVGVRYSNGAPFLDRDEAQYAEWLYVLDVEGADVYTHGIKVGRILWGGEEFVDPVVRYVVPPRNPRVPR